MKEEKHHFQESSSVELLIQLQRLSLFCSNAEEGCLLEFLWNQNEWNSFCNTKQGNLGEEVRES